MRTGRSEFSRRRIVSEELATKENAQTMEKMHAKRVQKKKKIEFPPGERARRVCWERRESD